MVNGEPRVVRVLALAALTAVLAIWMARPARAETIGAFTGTWRLQSSDAAAKQNQSVGGLFGPIGPNYFGAFSFNGSISNYLDEGAGCDFFTAPCTETWSGNFSGGTVSFAAFNSVSEYTFDGVIIGGSFQGGLGCDHDDCTAGNVASLTFVSTSTRFFDISSGEILNRWVSRGSFVADSACSFGTCGPITFGPLTMTTTVVPEPGSMALLGLGMAGAAVRRRLRQLS